MVVRRLRRQDVQPLQLGKHQPIDEVPLGNLGIVGQGLSNHPDDHGCGPPRRPDDDGSLAGLPGTDQAALADLGHLGVVGLEIHLIGHVFPPPACQSGRHQKLLFPAHSHHRLAGRHLQTVEFPWLDGLPPYRKGPPRGSIPPACGSPPSRGSAARLRRGALPWWTWSAGGCFPAAPGRSWTGGAPAAPDSAPDRCLPGRSTHGRHGDRARWPKA